MIIIIPIYTKKSVIFIDIEISMKLFQTTTLLLFFFYTIDTVLIDSPLTQCSQGDIGMVP